LSFPYAASYILKVYTGRELAAASLGSAYLHGIAKSPVWGRP
jgi:hypothetical protein